MSLAVFQPSGDCRGMFNLEEEGRAMAVPARAQLTGSAHQLQDLCGALKETKNSQGGSWCLFPPTWSGVSWADFDSVFKDKPKEREEESAAFENLFCHSQLMSLSTHSLGHE